MVAYNKLITSPKELLKAHKSIHFKTTGFLLPTPHVRFFTKICGYPYKLLSPQNYLASHKLKITTFLLIYKYYTSKCVVDHQYLQSSV
jgi:hypothetical protein